MRHLYVDKRLNNAEFIFCLKLYGNTICSIKNKAKIFSKNPGSSLQVFFSMIIQSPASMHKVFNNAFYNWKMKIIFYRFNLTFLALLIVTLVKGQNNPSIQVKYTNDVICVDGNLDESVWKNADRSNKFWEFFPSDSIEAVNPTEFKLLYNDETLYVGICASVRSDHYVVSSLRRDFEANASDNVTLMFDTFNDGATAFLFGVNPYGVQREAFIAEGGENPENFSITWDQKWQVETSMFKDHYVVEAAIPFSSLKFRDGESEWRLQINRWDMQTNEQSVWTRVPQNQVISSLAFMGDMMFEKPIYKKNSSVVLIPYLNTLGSKDFINGIAKQKITFGGDAKIPVGNSMNLDITLAPDFSNVEADDIFTNLTQYEMYQAEKRQFFIDNNDLFGSYGDIYNMAKPFFSRRIGIAHDTLGNIIENRILAGARLSGNINDNWRLGLLNIQTAEDKTNHIPSNNNMMVSLQRKMFARSSMGFFVINRETFKNYDFLQSSDRYNRVLGFDYNLASKNNNWTGKFYLHKSLQPDDKKGNYSAQTMVKYNNRKFKWVADLQFVDEDFRSDLGFVLRKGTLKSWNSIKLNFYPSKESRVSNHGPGIDALFFWRTDMDYMNSDNWIRLIYDVNFKNQSTLKFTLGNQYMYLTAPFDPAGKKGGIPLLENKDYSYTQMTGAYQSNPAKVFSGNLQFAGGQFYNGQSYTAMGELNFRIQPWAQISISTQYDAIRLPKPYSTADYWLVSPKVDITFSKSVFWSTLAQFSNQRKNLGINSRIQWRFAPLSDLYLVYNDNYLTDDFSPRFRSVNLKLTYWINI